MEDFPQPPSPQMVMVIFWGVSVGEDMLEAMLESILGEFPVIIRSVEQYNVYR